MSGLSPPACGVGSRFDDLRARLGGLSAMETRDGRSDVPWRLHSALTRVISGGVSQSVLEGLHAMQELQDSEKGKDCRKSKKSEESQDLQVLRDLQGLVEVLEEILGLDDRRLRSRRRRHVLAVSPSRAPLP